MKINYQPNPFHTNVELDDRDKQMILLAYQNEQYSDLLCDLNMRLKGDFSDPPLTDIEEIKKIAGKWAAICNLEVDSPIIQDYISYINDTHGGDCVCWSCTCIRCFVEDMLGINTLKGLGKHQAAKVLGSFGKDGNKPIDEVIASLETPVEYTKPETWPDQVGYEVHIPRWEKERLDAAQWLKKYKKEHGF
jgi:hypothetical protein